MGKFKINISKLVFYIAISLVIIAISLILPKIINILKLKFSSNTGFYLYSAVLQANAAIISIIGVFSIFKIQSYKSSVDILKNSLMADKGMHSHPRTIVKFDNFSLDKKRSKIGSKPFNGYIEPQLQDWISKEENIKKILYHVKNPIILLLIGILLPAVLIVLNTKISECNINFIAQVYYYYIIFEIIILFSVIKSIFVIIKS